MKERVAVLETKVGTLETAVEKQTVLLESIDRKLNKQAGFLSGVMFVLTGLAGIVGFAIKWMLNR